MVCPVRVVACYLLARMCSLWHPTIYLKFDAWWSNSFLVFSSPYYDNYFTYSVYSYDCLDMTSPLQLKFRSDPLYIQFAPQHSRGPEPAQTNSDLGEQYTHASMLTDLIIPTSRRHQKRSSHSYTRLSLYNLKPYHPNSVLDQWYTHVTMMQRTFLLCRCCHLPLLELPLENRIVGGILRLFVGFCFRLILRMNITNLMFLRSATDIAKC